MMEEVLEGDLQGEVRGTENQEIRIQEYINIY